MSSSYNHRRYKARKLANRYMPKMFGGAPKFQPEATKRPRFMDSGRFEEIHRKIQDLKNKRDEAEARLKSVELRDRLRHHKDLYTRAPEGRERRRIERIIYDIQSHRAELNREVKQYNRKIQLLRNQLDSDSIYVEPEHPTNIVEPEYEIPLDSSPYVSPEPASVVNDTILETPRPVPHTDDIMSLRMRLMLLRQQLDHNNRSFERQRRQINSQYIGEERENRLRAVQERSEISNQSIGRQIEGLLAQLEELGVSNV
jgi:hypothetical protein